MSETKPPPALAQLEQAAQGLLFPSETDAPLDPFFWPNASPGAGSPAGDSLGREISDSAAPSGLASDSEAPDALTPNALTPDSLAQWADIKPGEPIKTVKLDTFFRAATQQEEWHNDEEKAQVEKFKDLVKVIKDNLKDVRVFRLGDTAMDVYVVGKVEGGWAGLKTKVVET
jgi:hypothetical protein